MSVPLKWLGFLTLFMLFGLIVVPSAAQSDTTACTALVNLAISQLAANCSDMDGNSVCYGYNHAEAVSVPAEEQAFLSRPGDRIPLSTLKSIHTSPANPALGQWGAALLTVAPDENSADLLLLGDVTLENTSSTSQQSFTFRTDIEQPTCDQTPSVFAVRNSANRPTALSMNNASLQITSLVVFQWHSANNMTATIQSGQLQVVNGPIAQAGQTLVGVMDNNGQILFWSSPRSATDKELQLGQQVADAFNRVANNDTSIPIATLPIPTTVPQNTPEPTETCGTSITHVVEPNETLFRIALHYGTSVEAIVAANNIADRDQINPGDVLTIPCGVDSAAISPTGDTGTPAAPAGENGAVPTPFDCSSGLPTGLPPDLQYIIGQFCASHP